MKTKRLGTTLQTIFLALAWLGLAGNALAQGGMVQAWGRNSYGQTNVPSGLSNVVAIAAGQFHSLALIQNSSPLSPLSNPLQAGNTFTCSAGTQSGRGLCPAIQELSC